MTTANVKDLILDFNLYPRSELSSANVTLLREAAETGAQFPPIVADRASKRVIDGFHRVRVAMARHQDEINVEWRDYPNEAEMLVDAIQLNRIHGEPLQRYDLRRAIARLEDLGYARDRISGIVRIPLRGIEKIVADFGKTPDGTVVPIKRGLDHLRGTTLSGYAEKANKGYAGFPAAYYARQVRFFLETDPPINPDLVVEMGALIKTWKKKFAAVI